MLRARRKESATPTSSQMSQFDQGKYTVVRQHEASSEFNVQLFREALSKMEGRHNFSSFVKSKGLKKYWKEGGAYISHPRTTEELTKTVFSINVEESPPPISPSVYPPYNQIKFLDVTVQGESFLHNQIRRMVGVGVGIAMGKVDLGLVDRLLNQSEWDPLCSPCSPDGLYLAQVEYVPEALENATECFVEMMELEKVTRGESEDQLLEDQGADDDEEEDDMNELQAPGKTRGKTNE